MAASLPYEYISAVMIGAAMCGIICNIIRAGTLLVFSVEPEQVGTDLHKKNQFYSSLLFFGLASISCVICLVI
jgi:hypothetical protein